MKLSLLYRTHYLLIMALIILPPGFISRQQHTTQPKTIGLNIDAVKVRTHAYEGLSGVSSTHIEII